MQSINCLSTSNIDDSNLKPANTSDKVDDVNKSCKIDSAEYPIPQPANFFSGTPRKDCLPLKFLEKFVPSVVDLKHQALKFVKRKLEEKCKEKVESFIDNMMENFMDNLSGLEYNNNNIKYFALICIAFIIFCIFAILFYIKYFCSDSCSDLVPMKKLAKVVTFKTVEYFY